MTVQEQIHVTFGLDGSIKAETIGIKGSKCMASIALLESLLEAETVDSEYTKEFYELPVFETGIGEENNVG
jgi:Protein of unknown function (DUF2997)